MSHENVDLVRRMTDAFLAGDAATALALMRPDVEFEARARPDAGICVVTVDDRQIARIDMYNDAGEARAAMGLPDR